MPKPYFSGTAPLLSKSLKSPTSTALPDLMTFSQLRPSMSSPGLALTQSEPQATRDVILAFVYRTDVVSPVPPIISSSPPRPRMVSLPPKPRMMSRQGYARKHEDHHAHQREEDACSLHSLLTWL